MGRPKELSSAVDSNVEPNLVELAKVTIAPLQTVVIADLKIEELKVEKTNYAGEDLVFLASAMK